jgi:DNA-binding Lrp family transcriptional regulator
LGEKRSQIHIENYDELLLEIAATSFVEVAKQLEVSAPALQKHLKRHGYLYRYEEIVEYARQRSSGKEPEECSVQPAPTRITKKQYPQLYEAYCQSQNLRKVAQQFGCDVQTVKRACLANGFKKDDFVKIAASKTHKKVNQLDPKTEEVLLTFNSINEAARWLLVNGPKKPMSFEAAKTGIHRACTGKRPSAYGFHWEFTEK